MDLGRKITPEQYKAVSEAIEKLITKQTKSVARLGYEK